MELKPSSDKPTDIERLFCEIASKGWDPSLDEGGSSIRLWLEDYSLILRANGKWTLE